MKSCQACHWEIKSPGIDQGLACCKCHFTEEHVAIKVKRENDPKVKCNQKIAQGQAMSNDDWIRTEGLFLWTLFVFLVYSSNPKEKGARVCVCEMKKTISTCQQFLFYPRANTHMKGSNIKCKHKKKLIFVSIFLLVLFSFRLKYFSVAVWLFNRV